MQSLIIALIILFLAAIAIRIFRTPLRKWLYKLKTKMALGTLREAIHSADADKEKTGRKNIVIFNSTKQEFEPIQKKTLKKVSQVNKNKSNKAGKKKVVKHRPVTVHRVKEIEKKSLYVTN